MRIHYSFERLMAGISMLMLSAVTLAQSNPPPPTLAWNRTKASGLAVDADGNTYTIHYLTDPSDSTKTDLHLIKIDPFNNIVWDKVIDYFYTYSSAPPEYLVDLEAGPVIQGQLQRISWVTLTGGYEIGYVSIFANAVDTSGAEQGSGVDALQMGMDGEEVGLGMDRTGRMRILGNDDGGLYFDNRNPPASEVIADSAEFAPASNSWIVACSDGTANWAYFVRGYDPDTGAMNFSIPVDPSYGVTVQKLPGDKFALLYNKYDASNPGTYFHTVIVIDSYGNVLGQYPASGMKPGFVFQVAAYDSSSPIYVASKTNPPNVPGRPNIYLEAYQWNSTELFHTDWQPIGKIYPTIDGFLDLFDWPASNSLFIEHYSQSSATYDWGQRFLGASVPDNPGTVQDGYLVQGPNSFYINHWDGNGPSYLTRYATGTCIQRLTGPASFTGGQPLKVTINLNQAVSTGSTITVSMHSYSPHVKMPKGTLDEDFTIPAGQQTQDVTLSTTAPNSAPYKVALSIMQNGVRCVLYTTGN